ncbi:zinc finger domain-containing protein [Metarhizium brunneum]
MEKNTASIMVSLKDELAHSSIDLYRYTLAELWISAEADADGLSPSYHIFQASKAPQADATTYSLRRELHDLLSSGTANLYQTPVTTPTGTTPHFYPDQYTPRHLARPAPSLPGPRGPRGRLLPPPLPRKALSRHPRATSPSSYRGAAVMSVAYEPRSFIHEGAYPPIGDEHDHAADQRYTDSEVAEHLSHYTSDAALLGDDRSIMDDGTSVPDATRLDLGATGFSSPIQVSLHAPSIPEPISESKDASPGIGSPPSSRTKTIPKPDRDVVKQADGKFHCPLEECKEEMRAFSRKCEWNKHMDKHERPYRCPAPGCENLPGFTYSGGLLRHEREVHNKHGGPKNTVNCPHPNCKRHTGKGFSRQENLNEHLRRVHTTGDGTTPPAESVASPEDNESEKSSMKRKRRSSGQGDELTELRDEIKRVREENEKLKSEMEQQSQHSLAMMAQIAELQDALRHGMSPHGLGAPTAQMI